MNKKPYTAPTVKKVELAYKSAILGVCHTSPNLYPAGMGGAGSGWITHCHSQPPGVCPGSTLP